MYAISIIDYFYLFYLVAGFTITTLTFFIRSELIKIVSSNFSFITTFILILELGFFIPIFSHVAVSPISFKSNIIQRSNVDSLESSPWFKFSPQSEISSLNNARGEDFVYSWTTDYLGYKNLDTLNKNNNYKFLAIGDSMTEGMGVSVENTWTNIVSTKYGKSVYNAGVQGYSASQYLGTLVYLQDKINFNAVIIGHTPNSYKREANYINKRPDKATGGIEAIRGNPIETAQSNKLINNSLAFPQILKASVNYIKANMTVNNYTYSDTIKFSNYIPEVVKYENIDKKSNLKKNDYWIELVKSYRQIAKFCIINNKSLVLIAFPSRYEVYFGPSTRGLQSHLDDQYYVEFELLKEELSDLGIKFVDSYPVLTTYSKDALDNQLPYLIKDGHLSKYGNDVIAKLISSSL